MEGAQAALGSLQVTVGGASGSVRSDGGKMLVSDFFEAWRPGTRGFLRYTD